MRAPVLAIPNVLKLFDALLRTMSPDDPAAMIVLPPTTIGPVCEMMFAALVPVLATLGPYTSRAPVTVMPGREIEGALS